MKHIIAVLLAVLVVLGMAGCGKSEAVTKTEELINAIGDVSLNSEEAIIAAEEAYASLTEKEQAQVENVEILPEKRDEYNKQYADYLAEQQRIEEEKKIKAVSEEIIGQWGYYNDDGKVEFITFLDNGYAYKTLNTTSGKPGLWVIVFYEYKVEADRIAESKILEFLKYYGTNVPKVGVGNWGGIPYVYEDGKIIIEYGMDGGHDRKDYKWEKGNWEELFKEQVDADSWKTYADFCRTYTDRVIN